MIVKALGKEYQVKDITYKERRELHRLNAKAFWHGKVEPESYYDILEKVAEISGLQEADLNDLSMVEVDQVLQEVFTNYMGLAKNEDGD